MTSHFDRSDAEGVDFGDSDVECVHGIDLFEPCAKCKPPLWAACRLCGEPDAMPPDPLCDRCKYERHCADNGEGDDMKHETPDPFGGFLHELDEYAPIALVSMRNAIDANLKRRREELKKELEATEHALNGTRPRATRRDKGTTRAKENAA